MIGDTDPRARIIALLSEIAPLIAGLAPDDDRALAEAITDLYGCPLGQEALYWLHVGWALCDVEPESAAQS